MLDKPTSSPIGAGTPDTENPRPNRPDGGVGNYQTLARGNLHRLGRTAFKNGSVSMPRSENIEAAIAETSIPMTGEASICAHAAKTNGRKTDLVACRTKCKQCGRKLPCWVHEDD